MKEGNEVKFEVKFVCVYIKEERSEHSRTVVESTRGMKAVSNRWECSTIDIGPEAETWVRDSVLNFHRGF